MTMSENHELSSSSAKGKSASNEPDHSSTPFFQSDKARITVIASYWIVIFLGLPLWWYATSIQRLSLPKGRIEKWVHANDSYVKVPIEIYVDAQAPFNFQDVKASLLAGLGSTESLRSLDLNILPGSAIRKSQPARTNIYDIGISSSQNSKFILSDRSLLALLSPNNLQDLATTVSRLLIPPRDQASDLRVTRYSGRYRLAFSLLNENAATGAAARGWDVNGALERYIQPTLMELGVLHNFTIESQVQFHAPLAFSPHQAHGDSINGYVLDDDQLKVFVNSAEWSLASSVSNDPVLHFLLFIPDSTRAPLYVTDASGQIAKSNAFIVPQWGGIVVFNPPKDQMTSQLFHLSSSDLASTFALFRSQLTALLGVPSIPSNVQLHPDAVGMLLTGWQKDALMRRRAQENIRDSVETLGSIVNLVDKIDGMPVGEEVQQDMVKSLDELDQMFVKSSRWSYESFLHSARALHLSSKAFFNPNMVAMLYFPTEHNGRCYQGAQGMD
ncbi:GPI transamidase component [Tulasnella sp. 419]|nr:GPI transamidase component [Tulasnella sp. 419]